MPTDIPNRPDYTRSIVLAALVLLLALLGNVAVHFNLRGQRDIIQVSGTGFLGIGTPELTYKCKPLSCWLAQL